MQQVKEVKHIKAVLRYITTLKYILLSAGIKFALYILLSAPEDYEVIASSSIIFSLEQTSATVTVSIVDDNVLEDVEHFTVEVVVTGGQERVDIGDPANIFISNDDCEKISTPLSIYW